MMLAALLLAAVTAAPTPASDRTLRLPDGLEVAYVEAGKGEPALLLLHCGNCRKEIWRETIAAFAPAHRVVALDLPGHGRSGAGRKEWSIPALGADVAAAADALELGRLILVGNSLGGPVALESARRLGPKRVLGIVAVDTLHDVTQQWPEEDFNRVRDAYAQDFAKACDAHMLRLLPRDAPTATVERVKEETCGNDPDAFRGLFATLRAYDQAAALRDAGARVRAINTTLFPTNLEANRRHLPTFEVVLMEGVGHYPQVERPAEFQAHLRKAIQDFTGK
jgi:pimeloyl-ACP methyl ester carboxylesterase